MTEYKIYQNLGYQDKTLKPVLHCFGYDLERKQEQLRETGVILHRIIGINF